MNFIKGLLLSLPAVFILSESSSQERDSIMAPVTITASLRPEKITETGKNVQIIFGEQLRNFPANSIDELLRYLPGLEVQSRGPMGSQADISLRGGTFQQVLVILDGVRVNDPNTGHFSAYIPVNVMEIDRIEVLKGASSAVYGSDAVGGVIHVITKTFSDNLKNKKTETALQGLAGEYGLLKGELNQSLQLKKHHFSAGISRLYTNGQPQRGTRGEVDNSLFSLAYSSDLSSKLSVAARYSRDDREFGAQNFYTSFLSDTASERVAAHWSQIALNYKSDRSVYRLSASYKQVDDRYRFNPSALPNENDSRLFQLLATNDQILNPETILTSGVQFIQKQIISNDRGEHLVKQAAGFIIFNKKIEQLNLIPAARIEWNERSGWELIPQLQASYKLNRWALRASAGKTIRDADFTERFNNYQKAFVSGGRIGNPDLDEEKSFSYEMGFDFIPTSAWRISYTAFQRFHRGLIDYVNTPYSQMPRKVNLSPTGQYALAKNIAKARTSGMEADLGFNKKMGRQIYWGSLGLVWLNTSSSEATPSLYLSSHSDFLANFNIQTELKGFGLSLNGIYKIRDEQKSANALAPVSPEYFLMNALASYSFWMERMKLYVQMDNVFDKKYADVFGAAMPGRWIMGGLKLKI